MVEKIDDVMRIPISIAAGLLAAILLSPAVAKEAGFAALVNQALTEMDQEHWQDGLDLTTRAVDQYGKGDPEKTYGPQFGALYYHKGICEMKLGKWNEAMRSLEICYRDFPNKRDGGPQNIFQKIALLKWGEAAMGAKQWQLALTKFRKFIEERNRARDAYAQGSFYINLAVCHYQLGQFPEGNENLEIAIRNKHVFPTPDAGIIAGFEAMATAAIGRKNERALLDFIGMNREDLTLAPDRMCRYSQVFLKLAGNAITAEMLEAATALYQFVPSTEKALEATEARLKATSDPGTAAELRVQTAALQKELADGNPSEVIVRSGTALIQEKTGDLLGALATYGQLETHYPRSTNREQFLYQLVRLSSLVASPESTRAHAEIFLRDFPKSAHAVEITEFLKLQAAK